MRTRSDGSITTYQPKFTTVYGDGHSVVTSYGTPLKVGKTRMMIDSPIENFYARRAAGEVMVNPMISEVFEYAHTLGPSSINNPSAHGYYQYIETTTYDVVALAFLTYPQMWFLPDDDASIAALITEAVTAATSRAHSPPVETLVELAEARRTISSLADTARSFARFSSAMRTDSGYIRWLSQFASGRTRAERMASARQLALSSHKLRAYLASHWLKYRYFVRPLVLTGKAVVDEWNNRRKSRPERQTYRSFRYSDTSDVTTTTGWDGGGYWTGDIHSRLDHTVEVRAGVLVDLVRAPCMSGTNLNDYPSAAWELVPFSFVVDWFTNIGDLVSAEFPPVGMRQLGSWVLVSQKVSFSASEVNTPTAAIPSFSRSSGSSSVTCTAVRQVRVPRPDIGLTLRQSTVNITTSLNRLADAAALAVQHLR